MKKRVISILLLVIALFGFETIPVMAISVSEIEEDDNYLTFSEETLKNRIFDDIDFYSDVIAEYGDVTSLRISESYAVQNSGKDTFITFIFDNSSCIGYLTVTYNDGKYYSSISFDNLDYVYGYFIAGRPIYVRCMQSQVNSYEYLSFLPANEQNQGQIIELERYNLNIITTLADYTSYYIERNVVSVSNEMDPNYSTTTYTGMISQPSEPSKFVYTTPSGRVYDVWKYYRYSII